MTGNLRLIVAISVGLLVVGLVHYYFIKRFFRDTDLKKRPRRIGTAAIIVLCALTMAAFGLGRVLPFEIGRYVLFVPRVWMGVILVAFSILLVVDLVRLFMAGLQQVRKSAPLNPDRRRFFARLFAGGTAVTTAGIVGVSMLNAFEGVKTKRVEVSLKKLPKSLSGFTIVQLTDLHIGLTFGREWVRHIVLKVNALKPDLIAVTGDIVDGSVARLRHEVEPLGELKAPHGVFFVTGNHEYYSGAIEWIEELEKLGMRVLRNERVSVGVGADSFDLAGIDDYRSKGMAPGHDGPDMKRALEGRDPKREVVLLAHQPRVADEAAERKVGLVLSGHTHGGQIWPLTEFVYFLHPYRKGLHRHGEETQIYVSQGTGYWGPPMRLGTESEITVIKLV